ncbi:hypothetical protein LRS05_16440 [Flavobacterium sp. J372]|nr:hypothetical protein [Flavobacterium sp. J372]MCR5863594.1 hypothetical protein [Flavobacterium sp. J372]
MPISPKRARISKDAPATEVIAPEAPAEIKNTERTPKGKDYHQKTG